MNIAHFHFIRIQSNFFNQMVTSKQFKLFVSHHNAVCDRGQQKHKPVQINTE